MLSKHQLYIKLRKCELFKNSVSFLGHRLSSDGLSVEEAKINAIVEWPRPQCVRDIQSFIGCCSYYRKFIKRFSQLAAPLTELSKHNAQWKWTDVEENSFDSLKSTLSNAPVLLMPNYSKPFTITSDASKSGIGGVLTEEDENGHESPVAYFSRKLIARERNWSPYELECYALVQSLKHFRHYFEGQRVNLLTDHKALIYLNNQPKLNAKQARWISYINLFNYSIGYREGKTNKVADGLSRQHSSVNETNNSSDERLHIDCDLNYVSENVDMQLSRARLRYECSSVCVSTVESTLIEEIRQAQLNEFHPSEKRYRFEIIDNIIMSFKRYFIPLNHQIRNLLLQKCHDSHRHVGVSKTYELMTRLLA